MERSRVGHMHCYDEKEDCMCKGQIDNRYHQKKGANRQDGKVDRGGGWWCCSLVIGLGGGW